MIVEVTISKKGLAIDPVIVEANPPTYGFSKAAIQASQGLRFVPQFTDGEAVEVPGILYKYTFQMAR